MSYDANTFNSPNPIARFAHRNRLRRSLGYARSRLAAGPVLDYGCGSGAFVAALDDFQPGCVYGYEPFMGERCREGLAIYSSIQEVRSWAPFGTITLFETIEHLSDAELDAFLCEGAEMLADCGSILISAPIEIGPGLILKEMNRSLLRLRRSEHGAVEFLKASLLGLPARRAENIKGSHRGFDFRRSMRFLKQRGWQVDVLSFGPLPIGTWYGNSQVFLEARQMKGPKD